MSEVGCNGWANRSTWLVPLWIDNEYASYREKLDELAEHGEPVTAEDAERIAFGVISAFWDEPSELEDCPVCGHHGFRYEEGSGPWADGLVWDDVDWDEIAEHWEIERRQVEAYAQEKERGVHR